MATYSVNLSAGNEKYGGNESKKEELQYFSSGNMPSWSKNQPLLFWQFADNNEKANPFRKFKIALPEELSLEENISLVEKFIQNNLPMQPYTYAIHSKPAKMNPNHMNVHVHLMFFDRMLEEDSNISIEEFFKRLSKKKTELLLAVPKKIEKLVDREEQIG